MFKDIFRSTFLGVTSKVIAAGGSFLIFPLMLKQLGSDTFGIWMTISSTVGLLSFMDMGLGNTLMNYIAWNNQDKHAIIKYIKLAYIAQLILISCIIIAGLFFFKVINWGRFFNIDNPSADVMAGVLLTFIFFLLGLVTNSIYYVQKGMQNALLAYKWQLASTILYIISLYFVLSYSPQLKFIALVTFGTPVLIGLLNTLIYFYSLRNSFRGRVKLHISEFRKLISDSSLFLFLQVAAIIAFETDCLILAHYLNFDAVTKFTIVAKIYSIPAILLGVYLQILWPLYAKAFGENQWQLIKNTFNRSILASLCLVTAFIIVVLIFKDIVLIYWLSSPIEIPTSLFVAFSCWTLVRATDANIGVMLNGMNKLKIQLILAGCMVVSNLVLSIIFVKHWGVQGVVWATFFSTLIFSVLPFYFYIKKLFRTAVYAPVEKGN